MRTNIVRIGNSQGLRIPKLILKQTGLSGEVDLIVDGDQLIIKNANHPRSDWNAVFAKMDQDEQQYLMESTVNLSSWDEQEWEW